MAALLCLIPSAGCTNLHHEVELGVIIGKRGTDIPVASAMDHVSGYLLCLDMTARELQEIAKKKGEPWSTAKGSGHTSADEDHERKGGMIESLASHPLISPCFVCSSPTLQLRYLLPRE